MNKVSVCITHYGRAEKLGATLDSLLNQTRVPDEVLLWDDCSPRDPGDIAQAYQAKFKNFRYHRNTENLNMPGNLNAVIRAASGDIIANVHDADTYCPQYLERLCGILERHPTVGFAFCGLDSTGDASGSGKLWTYQLPEKMEGRSFFENHYKYSWSSKVWGTVVAKRQVYERLMPFNSKFRNWSDVDMWMRACLQYDVGYVDLPMIITDNTETSLRKFSWYKVLVMHQMACENIERLHHLDSSARSAALRRRQIMLWLRWSRHIAAGLARGDYRRLKGVSLPFRPGPFWGNYRNEIPWIQWKP